MVVNKTSTLTANNSSEWLATTSGLLSTTGNSVNFSGVKDYSNKNKKK